MDGIVAGKIYHTNEFDEVLGSLNITEEFEGGVVALIEKIPEYLPLKLTGKLKGLIGWCIGVTA